MNAFLHRHRDKVLLVCGLLLVFTIAVSFANKTLQPKGYIGLFALLALVLLSLLFGDAILRRWFAANHLSNAIEGAAVLIGLVASAVAALLAFLW